MTGQTAPRENVTRVCFQVRGGDRHHDGKDQQETTPQIHDSEIRCSGNSKLGVRENHKDAARSILRNHSVSDRLASHLLAYALPYPYYRSDRKLKSKLQ